MKRHHYTREEVEWLKVQPASMTWQEVADAFNKRFNADITASKISDRIGRDEGMRVRGKNVRRTQFREGSRERLPVGSEVVKQGYIWVKVNNEYWKGADYSEYTTNWRRKADVVYEKTYGKIPHGKFIVYLDQNPLNCELSNLYLVDRPIHAIMAKNRWYVPDANLTRLALIEAELLHEIGYCPD